MAERSSDTLAAIRANKMSKYQAQVALPFAEDLLQVDPRAVVLASGSFAQHPDRLRAGSDFDLIVISSALREPQQYVEALENLRRQNQRFREDTAIVPFHFTQVAREESARYIAYTTVRDTLPDYPNGLPAEEGVLPVHFLYYPTVDTLKTREPKGLAKNLIENSHVIAGERPTYGKEKTRRRTIQETNLETVAWNMERAIAEFILNQDVMPYEYTVAEYKAAVWQTIRNNYRDGVLPHSARNGDVRNILDQIDPTLIGYMEPLDDIHRNGSTRRYPVDVLIEPAQRIIQQARRLSATPQ